MSEIDIENEPLELAVDPPSNDGGTKTTAAAVTSLDSTNTDALAVDPPSNDGGTGK